MKDMKLSFRWFGETDNVKLDYIKQIPKLNYIVSALYDVTPGEVWKEQSIINLKNKIESKGLKFEVIESVPVCEEIKLGSENKDYFINNFKENIKLLGRHGIKVICYNFMSVFDWTRSSVDYELADKSKALVYYEKDIEKVDITKREISLPGWDESYSQKELVGILDKYKNITKEDLWKNLEYFLKEIIPVAREYDVKMAIHPDDPPWDIFGLPRIICDENSIDRLLGIVDDEYNGLTFCTGSLGAASFNDIEKLIDKYSKMRRIHFLHLRNVKRMGEKSFEESAHNSCCGSLDMVKILKILYKNNFDSYIRPDHGRMIWGEKGKSGYGLYDRALGASYISGIWECIDKFNSEVE